MIYIYFHGRTILKVELDGGKLVSVETDPEETKHARQRIAEKMSALLRGDHLK
jgi:hypothetical protein